MRILFEEHKYQPSEVEADLNRICDLQDVDKTLSVGMVGYFYNSDPDIHDCVFILPKVLLEEKEITGSDGKKVKIDVIAGVEKEDGTYVRPEDIITPEGQQKYLGDDYRKFIYEFSVWIYRALTIYRQNNPQTDALRYRQIPQEGKGQREKMKTFLDIILSLIRFNKDNQDYFFFIVKNLHSGHNKINWTKTISHSQAYIQDEAPIYLNPVNKKRKINFDEELMVIFFSILNYLNEAYGFNAPIPLQYELIKGLEFEHYRKGIGKIRLRQIKYKYFSDKALELWNLCFAFFETDYTISVNTTQKEYLLATKFEVVFEAMIDELIGDKNVPKGLKEQQDNKRIDHLYTYDGIINSNDQNEQIYYIGDSKYYKSGNRLRPDSIYKQFTYARNVIQWNIDLFVNEKVENWDSRKEYDEDKEKYKRITLRDDKTDSLTEGYNVIPNFFISAFVDEKRKYNDEENIRNRTVIVDGKKVHKTYISTQFKNRLFDRDTLILSHYDVNFLYILSLYARNRKNEKAAWKKDVRDIFRKEIRQVLTDKYDFYALKCKGNPFAGEEFIKEHFKELQGKLYRPYEDKELFLLALEKQRGKSNTESEAYRLLEEFFVIKQVNLGDNPQQELNQKVVEYQAQHPYSHAPQNWLPEYHIEKYVDDYFLVGHYHDKEHWDWITGKNDMETLIFDIQINSNHNYSISENRIRKMRPKFAILYEEGHESENKYHVFRIHDFAVMSEGKMIRAMYPINHGGPKGDYFVFRLDEEISIGRFDINRYINESQFKDRMLLSIKGEDLLKYRL